MSQFSRKLLTVVDPAMIGIPVFGCSIVIVSLLLGGGRPTPGEFISLPRPFLLAVFAAIAGIGGFVCGGATGTLLVATRRLTNVTALSTALVSGFMVLYLPALMVSHRGTFQNRFEQAGLFGLAMIISLIPACLLGIYALRRARHYLGTGLD